MALFDRKVRKAAISPAPAKAAAAGSSVPASVTARSMIGQYYTYQEGWSRNTAMQVAAISRARDLHASLISSLPLRMYRETWNESEQEMTKTYLAPRSWLRRPDPATTYPFLMAWTFDDLFFYGRAFWYVSARTQDGYPAAFTRLPAGSMNSIDQVGPVWFAPSNELTFNGAPIDSRDVIQFLSPVQGIVYMSETTIETALKIEQARNRNAASAVPSGILRQTGGEPLSATELAEIATQFNLARMSNQTAALNEFLTYEPTTMTPDKMLLIESANYSALEISRLCNIPPYLNGVSTGSYSYQSSEQARWDLWLFGSSVYANAIAATLSGDNVLPRGTYVEFDIDEYLTENMVADKEDPQPAENTQEALAE